jgi:hypothetical protein
VEKLQTKDEEVVKPMSGPLFAFTTEIAQRSGNLSEQIFSLVSGYQFVKKTAY